MQAWELWLERNPNSRLDNAIEGWRNKVNSESGKSFPKNCQQIGELGLLYGPEGPDRGLYSKAPVYLLELISDTHWMTLSVGSGRERLATTADTTIQGQAVLEFTDWFIPDGTYDTSATAIEGMECKHRGCPYDKHDASSKQAFQEALKTVYSDINGHPMVQAFNGIYSVCGVGCGFADHIKEADTWVGKDGALTKAVEQVFPGGGLITAVFHAAAGNEKHAQQAAIKGVISGVTTVAIVATGGFAAAAGGAVPMALGAGAMVVIAGAGKMTETASLAALTGAPIKDSIFYDGLSGSLSALPGAPGAVIGAAAPALLEAGGLTSDNGYEPFLACDGEWDQANEKCLD